MSAPTLSLAENLVLMAGAGTGKTHGLISLCLHVLGGARPTGEPLPPARLCAVTFTEKAAAEMKLRLRGRLLSLAEGKGDEADLLASYAQLGRPPPKAAFWEKVHGGIGTAFVGTFHSYCAQVLRRFPAEARLDPGFSLLAEAEAKDLFLRCAEDRVLRALERGGGERDGAERLVRALGFSGQGDFGACLLELLLKVHLRLAEDGRAAESLPEPRPEASFESTRDALAASVREALALARLPRVVPLLPSLEKGLAAIASAAVGGAERALAATKELHGSINLVTCGKEAKPILKRMRDECAKAFALACGDAIAAPLHRDFLSLLSRAEAFYREEKERRSALDFADLVRRARDLLRDVPSVRLEAQARVGTLLVDECQDTNGPQLDVVALLCERREGAPRAVVGSAFDELPLEPSMLACVGDRKQSIYEFRGADVTVFTAVAERLSRGEGRVAFLKTNRRSRPGLLRFFNGLFAEVMKPLSEAKWRVDYRPEEDDLLAFRPEGPAGPCVELLRVAGEDADERRVAEARAVAGRIASLLQDGADEVVGDGALGGTFRRASGKDIVVLLRRFRNLDLFRRELLARSIPHVVVNGGGFFRAQEVLDLRSLLFLLADPTDRLSLCAVLRSPLVLLSDLRLAGLASHGRLSLYALLEDGLFEGAPSDEASRLAAFLAVSERVREAEGLGVAEVLETFVRELDLEAVLAGGFEGEQKVANVRKLVAWARAESPPGAAAAARKLLTLEAEEGREGQAALVEESDPGAVRIMTVHQSKGLEFPVVFVPECGTRGPPHRDGVLFDRVKGLCVRPRGEDGKLIDTSGAQGVLATLHSRQQAELARLFYVAATRARDLLVFSGEVSRGGGTWRDHLEGFASVAGASELMKVVDAVPAPFFQVAEEKAAGGGGAAASPDQPLVSRERLVAQTQGPMRLSVRSLVAPVTQLADFSLCPRRHHFAHALGLEEQPARTQREQEPQPERSSMGAAERGTLVHRALERIDFGAPASGQVRSLLASEGRSVDSAEAISLIDDVAAFAESPLGRQLAGLPASRLLRELPFLLAVGDDDLTLHVRGAVDVLAVLEDGTALVLDYKHTAASGRGADDYAFQLACYALAMRGFLPRGVTLCAGIAFLKDRGAPPDVRTLSDAALAAFERSLAVMGKELLERQRTKEFPVLSRPRCEALRCGFAYLCHRSLS